MKIKKISIFLLIAISMMLLAACNDNVQNVPYDPLDERKYENAVSTLNEEMCDEIQDQELCKTCKNTIKSEKLINEALAGKNLAKCKEILLKESQYYCEIEVNKLIELDKATEEKEKIQEQNDKIHQEAVDDIDADRCEDIKDDNIRVVNCKNSVYHSKAIQENNKDYCNLIEDESLIDICLSNF